MKKAALLFICLSAFLIAFLCSCAGGTVSDPFTDFYGDIRVQCVLDIQGERSEIVFSRGGGEMKTEFIAPETLRGFVMKRSEEKISFGYGDFTVPMDERAALILLLCSEAFSPFYTEMTKIGSSETDAGNLTVIESGDFIYTFFSDGKPKSVGGVYKGRQFAIEISSLTKLSERADDEQSLQKEKG